MTPQELADLVASIRRAGDDVSEVEAKLASTSTLPKSCKESLSAFANTRGGVLILGLDEGDGFAATGVTRPDKLMKDLASLCATGLAPALRPNIELQPFEGVDLIVCEVEGLSSAEKPCYVTSAGMANGSYVRVHDGDQRLSQYEIQLLLANRGQPIDDSAPVLAATIDDLDSSLVEIYAARLRESRPYAFAELETMQLLKRSHITTTSDGKIYPTLAGLLALGRYPQEFYPQLNITFVHYPSPEGDDPASGERFIDNVALDGPIPVMVRDALRVLRRNMSRRSIVSGAGRTDSWEYPETALREAIVNACIHRDLSSMSRGAQVQIEMYPDRLIVRNPGGLYGPVSEQTLGEEGLSSSRNAALLRVLEDVPLPGDTRTVCENRGSGISAMINALRAANMSPPQFRNKISLFEVTFPNHALLNDEMIEWIGSLNSPDLTSTQCVGLAAMKQVCCLHRCETRCLHRCESRF